MAVSPLGSIIFTNQNTQVAAANQNNILNRYDMQNAAAQSLVNEKEKVVEETRPAEEMHKIDPDREHNSEEADEQEKDMQNAAKKTSKKSDKDKGFSIDEEGRAHLDIHV